MLPLLPDAEILVRSFLAGHASIQALVAQRVSTELPTNPQFPLITLRRFGGIAKKLWADHPQIEVQAWGRTKVEASHVARTAFAVLMDAPQIHDQGVLVNVSPGSPGITPVPDETFDPPQPRYIFGVVLTTHPHDA